MGVESSSSGELNVPPTHEEALNAALDLVRKPAGAAGPVHQPGITTASVAPEIRGETVGGSSEPQSFNDDWPSPDEDGPPTPASPAGADVTSEPAVANRPVNILSGEEERRVRQENIDFYRNEVDKRISAFQQGNLHMESLTSFLPWDLVLSRYEAGSQELEDAFARVRNVLTPEEFERIQGLFYENIASLINVIEFTSSGLPGGWGLLPGDAGWLDQYRRDIIAHPERGIKITNDDEEWNKWVANPVQTLATAPRSGITTASVPPARELPVLPTELADFEALRASGDLIPLDPRADPVNFGPESAEPAGSGLPGDEAGTADTAAASTPARPLTDENEQRNTEITQGRELVQEWIDVFKKPSNGAGGKFSIFHLEHNQLERFQRLLVSARFSPAEAVEISNQTQAILIPIESRYVQASYRSDLASLINAIELPEIYGRTYRADGGWLNEWRQYFIDNPQLGVEITVNDEDWNNWLADLEKSEVIPEGYTGPRTPWNTPVAERRISTSELAEMSGSSGMTIEDRSGELARSLLEQIDLYRVFVLQDPKLHDEFYRILNNGTHPQNSHLLGWMEERYRNYLDDGQFTGDRREFLENQAEWWLYEEMPNLIYRSGVGLNTILIKGNLRGLLTHEEFVRVVVRVRDLYEINSPGQGAEWSEFFREVQGNPNWMQADREGDSGVELRDTIQKLLDFAHEERIEGRLEINDLLNFAEYERGISPGFRDRNVKAFVNELLEERIPGIIVDLQLGPGNDLIASLQEILEDKLYAKVVHGVAQRHHNYIKQQTVAGQILADEDTQKLAEIWSKLDQELQEKQSQRGFRGKAGRAFAGLRRGQRPVAPEPAAVVAVEPVSPQVQEQRQRLNTILSRMEEARRSGWDVWTLEDIAQVLSREAQEVRGRPTDRFQFSGNAEALEQEIVDTFVGSGFGSQDRGLESVVRRLEGILGSEASKTIIDHYRANLDAVQSYADLRSAREIEQRYKQLEEDLRYRSIDETQLPQRLVAFEMVPNDRVHELLKEYLSLNQYQRVMEQFYQLMDEEGGK
ncbi:MAG: hypothetical protein G01um10147_623 [Microgenomates group bacterium Gr01-1014_7]|nr:MAG: hypothetical protein G01um10147_623 [Microgenomates group bacterium Gr01-1014_7]